MNTQANCASVNTVLVIQELANFLPLIEKSKTNMIWLPGMPYTCIVTMASHLDSTVARRLQYKFLYNVHVASHPPTGFGYMYNVATERSGNCP